MGAGGNTGSVLFSILFLFDVSGNGSKVFRAMGYAVLAISATVGLLRFQADPLDKTVMCDEVEREEEVEEDERV